MGSMESPRSNLLPILEHIKQSYLLWHGYHSILVKAKRYTLGEKIDVLFIDIIEVVSGAVFLPRQEKLPYLRVVIRKLDTLQLLLMILWETKTLETKKYAVLSAQLVVIGKMLGGWYSQVEKQNSPSKVGEK
jgi:hypothetical protein